MQLKLKFVFRNHPVLLLSKGGKELPDKSYTCNNQASPNSYDSTTRLAQFHHILSQKINQKLGELATQLLGSNSQPKRNYALQNPKQEVKNILKATAANPEFAFSRQKGTYHELQEIQNSNQPPIVSTTMIIPIADPKKQIYVDNAHNSTHPPTSP